MIQDWKQAKMTKEKIQEHARSALLTMGSTFLVEIYVAMNAASDWGDIGWRPLLSAASFTAVRAVLRVMVKK